MRHLFPWTIRGVAVLVLSVGLIAFWESHITDAKVHDDAQQNLLMAVNLAHHGVISLDMQAPFSPTNYREPIPVIVSAFAIMVIDAIKGTTDTKAYFEGVRLRYVKFQSIFWLALLCICSYWTLRTFVGSFYIALIGALLIGYIFGKDPSVDNLYTDLPAASVLMLTSTLLSIAVQRDNLVYLGLGGVTFGVLALIKAVAFYVFTGVFFVLAVFYVVFLTSSWTVAVRNLAVLVIAFGCVIGPWSYRNHSQLGSFRITQRGGAVLMMRARYNQMTFEEYRGAFYAWAPYRLPVWTPPGLPSFRYIVRVALGFSPRDLQRGGRLQRLNRKPNADFADDDLAAEKAGRPDKAISYYHSARAERVLLIREAKDEGIPFPDVVADERLEKRAMKLIREHPWRHLMLTIPFLWRGALFVFPILCAGLIMAIKCRNYALATLLLPSFGMVMFYALLSHFIPRYSDPMKPMVVVVLIILLMSLWQYFQGKYSQSSRVMSGPG